MFVSMAKLLRLASSIQPVITPHRWTTKFKRAAKEGHGHRRLNNVWLTLIFLLAVNS